MGGMTLVVQYHCGHLGKATPYYGTKAPVDQDSQDKTLKVKVATKGYTTAMLYWMLLKTETHNNVKTIRLCFNCKQ